MGSTDESDGRRRRWGVQEHLDRPGSFFAQHREDQRLRHAEPGWYDWLLREFARYWYMVGVLAVVVLVPLQIEASFTPSDASPVAISPIVVLAMLGAAIALIVAGAIGYRQIWMEDGLVERAIERREDRKRETEDAAKRVTAPSEGRRDS